LLEFRTEIRLGYNPAMLGLLFTTPIVPGLSFAVLLPGWLNPNDIWRLVQSNAADDNLVPGLVIVVIVAMALRLLAPDERKHVRVALIVFLLSGVIMLASILITLYGEKSWGNATHTVGYLIGGYVVINLIGIFLFEVVLSSCRVHAPRIIRDLLL